MENCRPPAAPALSRPLHPRRRVSQELFVHSVELGFHVILNSCVLGHSAAGPSLFGPLSQSPGMQAPHSLLSHLSVSLPERRVPGVRAAFSLWAGEEGEN